MTAQRSNNKHFSVTDRIFLKACILASIPTTTRQASKYRMKKGAAYKCAPEARILYAKEVK